MAQQMLKFSNGLELINKSYSESERDTILQEIEDKGYQLTTDEWEILISLFNDSDVQY